MWAKKNIMLRKGELQEGSDGLNLILLNNPGIWKNAIKTYLASKCFFKIKNMILH